MDQNELIDSITQLAAIPSVTGDAVTLRQALEFVANIITERCPDATIEYFEDQGVTSLLAYKSGQRPNKFHVLLNGHLDVVPAKPELFQARVENGKLYGRGVYDMKAAALVMTDVFCELVNKVPYELGLQIVTDEEVGGPHGSRYQIRQGVRSDFVICGECGRATDKYEIANTSKGILWATIEFLGTSSHSAYLWRGDNAAVKAARFAAKLDDRYPTPPGPTSNTTIAITAIDTDNDAHNKVPAQAIVKVDARYDAHDPNFASVQAFEQLIADIDPEAHIIAYDELAPPMYTKPDNPLLLKLKAVAERIEGRPFNLVTRDAGSDGRLYNEVGNEACEFGIAGENQHGDNEYVPVQAIFTYRNTLREYLKQLVTATD